MMIETNFSCTMHIVPCAHTIGMHIGHPAGKTTYNYAVWNLFCMRLGYFVFYYNLKKDLKSRILQLMCRMCCI